MAGFPTLPETATIDAVSLFTPAWVCTNLSATWGVGRMTPHWHEVPGGDPIALGVTRRPRQVGLPMSVAPDVDQAGAPHASPTVGLELNLAALEAAVSSLTGDGVRTMTVKRASGAEIAGRVMVLGIELGRVGVFGAPDAVIDVVLLDGWLAPVAP